VGQAHPTLLGPEKLRAILNDQLGFDITVPDSAFAHDPGLADAMQMVVHFARGGQSLRPNVGIKLSNTLEVVNHRALFPPSEKMMYMSGARAASAHRHARACCDRSARRNGPISFCGGADCSSFASLLADGLGPVTVCTDLLKPGGYARLHQYVSSLSHALDRTGARSLDEFALRAAGAQDPSELSAATRRNLARHAQRVVSDSAIRSAQSSLPWPKQAVDWDPYDCIAAPCQKAAPHIKNIPDYLHWIAKGEFQKGVGGHSAHQTRCRLLRGVCAIIPAR